MNDVHGKRWRYWAGVLGVMTVASLLQWPVLGLGYTLDDYAQIAMLEGFYPSERSPWDLYTFSDGQPGDVTALVDAGFYPWWAHPRVRLSMFRPLASLLIGLDHRLLGVDAWAQHLHSLGYWWAMLLAVALLFEGLLDRRVAFLAFAIFALDQPHAVSLGWLANRTSILSALFGTLALQAYLRFRQRGAWQLGARASLLYGVALAAGEYGLSMLGFFVAYEWLGRGEPARRRLASLAWVLTPALAYLVARGLVHAGARHSEMYLDPVGSPGLFAEALRQRYPVLIADALLSLRSEYWSFGLPWTADLVSRGLLDPSWLTSFDPWRRVHEAIGFGALLAFGWAILRVARAAPTVGGGHAVWLGVGALLCALPLPGSLPTSRLLLIPGIGVAALLASLLWAELARLARPGPATGATGRVLPVLLATAVVGLHLTLAPIQGRAEVRSLTYFTPRVRDAILRAPFDPEAAPKQRAVLVASGDPTLMIYVGLIRRLHGLVTPRSLWVLSGNRFPFRLERPDPSTLVLRYPPGVSMLSEPFEWMFRSSDTPIARGERFRLDGMTVTALETRDGRPTAMAFAFDAPLEHPRWLFLFPTREGIRHFPLPPVGASIDMPPPIAPLARP